MSDYNSRLVLTPADFADTGQWRLIIYISHVGMRAFLKHISDKSRPMAEMFSIGWKDADSATLLNNIENVVYDHPGLLDDYATDIIIRTSKVCFVPNNFLDEDSVSEEDIFTSLFPGEGQEVIADRLRDCTALFTLVRGLDGFFSRTIPGARIRSHLAVLTEHFRRHKSAGPRIYLDIREGKTDILAFKDENLLSASVQRWKKTEDIAYRIFNLINTYGLKPLEATIYMTGPYEIKNSVTELIRPYCREVTSTPLPVNLPDEMQLPLPVVLQAFR